MNKSLLIVSTLLLCHDYFLQGIFIITIPFIVLDLHYNNDKNIDDDNLIDDSLSDSRKSRWLCVWCGLVYFLFYAGRIFVPILNNIFHIYSIRPNIFDRNELRKEARKRLIKRKKKEKNKRRVMKTIKKVNNEDLDHELLEDELNDEQIIKREEEFETLRKLTKLTNYIIISLIITLIILSFLDFYLLFIFIFLIGFLTGSLNMLSNETFSSINRFLFLLLSFGIGIITGSYLWKLGHYDAFQNFSTDIFQSGSLFLLSYSLIVLQFIFIYLISKYILSAREELFNKQNWRRPSFAPNLGLLSSNNGNNNNNNNNNNKNINSRYLKSPETKRLLETVQNDFQIHQNNKYNNNYIIKNKQNNNNRKLRSSSLSKYKSYNKSYANILIDVILKPFLNSNHPVYQRFLIGCRNNKQDAINRLKNTCMWRLANDIDNIVEQKQPYFFDIKKSYPTFIHDKSIKQGYMVYFEKLGDIDLSVLDEKKIYIGDILRHYVFMAEYFWRYVEPNQGKGCIITVMDVEGVAIKDLGGITLEFLKKATKVMREHYVERGVKTFIVNAPMWFGLMWKMISPFLDSRTKERVAILRAGDMTELVKYVGKEALPPEYGGIGCKLGESKYEKDLIEYIDSINNNGLSENIPRKLIIEENDYKETFQKKADIYESEGIDPINIIAWNKVVEESLMDIELNNNNENDINLNERFDSIYYSDDNVDDDDEMKINNKNQNNNIFTNILYKPVSWVGSYLNVWNYGNNYNNGNDSNDYQNISNESNDPFYSNFDEEERKEKWINVYDDEDIYINNNNKINNNNNNDFQISYDHSMNLINDESNYLGIDFSYWFSSSNESARISIVFLNALYRLILYSELTCIILILIISRKKNGFHAKILSLSGMISSGCIILTFIIYLLRNYLPKSNSIPVSIYYLRIGCFIQIPFLLLIGALPEFDSNLELTIEYIILISLSIISLLFSILLSKISESSLLPISPFSSGILRFIFALFESIGVLLGCSSISYPLNNNYDNSLNYPFGTTSYWHNICVIINILILSFSCFLPLRISYVRLMHGIWTRGVN